MSTAGKIADYFGDAADQAVITEAFVPGVGWRQARTSATVESIRALKTHRGATAIAVQAAGRTADFQVDEVLAYAQRPMFGGRVI